MKTLRLSLFLLLLSSTLMAQELIIKEKVKFLALGDSYTIGESVAIKDRWPVQLIESLRKLGLECNDAQIIATTGWRTDNLKNAIIDANLSHDFTLVSLLIGVNNQYQGKTVEDYAPEFEELLNTAILLAGGIKSNVFVVSIPDYGYTPFGKGNQPTITQAINSFNSTNKAITEKLGIKYFNITEISRNGLAYPELVANDGLHPSGLMYTQWVELILKGAIIPEKDVVTDVKKKNEEASIQVYPNPFHDVLIFDNLPSSPKNISVDLLNNNGSIVLSKVLVENQKRIDLELKHLSAGLYHYRVKQNETVFSEGNVVKL